MSRERLAADAIRVLAMDAVQRANSGHPGMPMGMADLATVLFHDFLVADPADPLWPDRDRFVLSNGHGSMLLYAVLHLCGYPMSIDDLRSFRQLHSPTPGHPEIDQRLGIEMTTGPLGQGFATGVGMAAAEAHLRAVHGADLVDHRTFGFVSDGDLMEGVAAEAASLAGHLGLGKLVYLYDDNAITLVGPASWTFTEDVPRRFEAYGWHTITVDGHDHDAIREAIAAAIAEDGRPSLISAKTHIGFGSPNKQDTASAHGSPLGPDEIALVRDALGWSHEPFVVPGEVYDFFAEGARRGAARRDEWNARVAEIADLEPERHRAWVAFLEPDPPALSVPDYEPGTAVATRKVSGAVIQQLAELRPDVVGGSADLASSTNTLIASSTDFSAKEPAGRNFRFGVREHAMGAMVNGMTIHGGLRAFGATFLTFSDYMRGAVRLGALMGAPAIWVWTHDSIFLGEDGPTHQPVEHVAALRAIPGLWVIRPATPAEVTGAWTVAVARTDAPTAIVLTRQDLPVPHVDADPAAVALGAWIARDGDDATLVATGSELWVALEAAEILAGSGTSLRVVSMPCMEAFAAQEVEFRDAVLGPGPVASVEAAATFGWRSVVGDGGLSIGVDRFGASAPWSVLAEEYEALVRA